MNTSASTWQPCYFLLNVVLRRQSGGSPWPSFLTCYFLLNVVWQQDKPGMEPVQSSLLFSFECCCSHRRHHGPNSEAETCYFLLNVVWMQARAHTSRGKTQDLLFSFECCRLHATAGTRAQPGRLAIFF